MEIELNNLFFLIKMIILLEIKQSKIKRISLLRVCVCVYVVFFFILPYNYL